MTKKLPLTPKQQKRLDCLDRAPWRWFTSDKRYFALVDRFERENQSRYYEVLNRVTTYTGPDYRVLPEGQRTWIRATELQYEQADVCGVPRSIGVPELATVHVIAA